MNGFNDKALQAIWDGLGLPADISKQEEFERLVYEWAGNNEQSVCCKDCKHICEEMNCYTCYHRHPDGVLVTPDGFCDWGERRDDA